MDTMAIGADALRVGATILLDDGRPARVELVESVGYGLADVRAVTADGDRILKTDDVFRLVVS